MLFRQFLDRKLGQYAYLVGCPSAGEAIVIDPLRDVDVYFAAAELEGLKLTAAVETHIHADYLSGLRELAERGVAVFASDEGGADWRYEWLDGDGYKARRLKNGDTFAIGNVHFESVHTPGHTPEHLVFLVTDKGGGASRPMGAFTGDFLFVGDVGRPDLLETATGKAGASESAARDLYRSIQRFREFSDDLQVWPGHGAGSACGKSMGSVPMSTLGYEKSFNASLLAATGESEFVSWILDAQPEPPLYFGRMKQQNRSGPRILGSLPRPRLLREQKFDELSGATGVAVLDTRAWEQYREGHLQGALFVPLGNAFNTVAGCYVPDEMAIYLIIEEDRLAEAIVDLVNVGLDNVVGYATPEMFASYGGGRDKMNRIEEVAAAELEEHLVEGAFLLDVRGEAEVKRTGRIAGAKNIAYTRLLDSLEEIPARASVVAYCDTGIRSAYASSLLDRFGHRVTNVAGGFVGWKKAGGEVSRA